jgi:hypothetical protein
VWIVIGKASAGVRFKLDILLNLRSCKDLYGHERLTVQKFDDSSLNPVNLIV